MDELVEVLGVQPEDAAKFAAALLEHPHPLVGSGAAVWNRPSVNTPDLALWKANLPRIIETGDIPGQQALDTWATDRTMGLIKRFPLQVTADVVLVMATALATKVSMGSTIRSGACRRPPPFKSMGDEPGPGSAVAIRP